MKSAIIALLAVLAGCGQAVATDTTATPSEVVRRGGGAGQIQAFDMKDGVRCYLYVGWGISCLKVTP